LIAGGPRVEVLTDERIEVIERVAVQFGARSALGQTRDDAPVRNTRADGNRRSLRSIQATVPRQGPGLGLLVGVELVHEVLVVGMLVGLLERELRQHHRASGTTPRRSLAAVAGRLPGLLRLKAVLIQRTPRTVWLSA
jgi:hypothetical protein